MGLCPGVPSQKSFAELMRNKNRFSESPAPIWKTFGAPFAQNDSVSFVMELETGHEGYFVVFSSSTLTE